MIFEEFMYYLDAYGASLERWPQELRPAASAFLAASAAAAAAQAETARLDALLDRLALGPGRESETRVRARTLTGASRPRRAVGIALRANAARLWPRAAVLALVAVLGIIAGSVGLESQQTETTPLDVAQLHTDESPFEVAGL